MVCLELTPLRDVSRCTSALIVPPTYIVEAMILLGIVDFACFRPFGALSCSLFLLVSLVVVRGNGSSCCSSSSSCWLLMLSVL